MLCDDEWHGGSWCIAVLVREALGKIGSLDAVPGLIKVLNHSDAQVRKSAVETLGLIGDARSVSALSGMLCDAQ
ncbi:MAG TPA: HEAT repeat domain-containing protein [Chlamydiales bacterium]|jgi:HEAT repeat protein|nr:HEAT repeat domain-containing protein [Chlamydiales bacterium]